MKKQKIWIWLDPTNRCNLSCDLCYTKESHSNLDLSLENFKKMNYQLSNSHHEIQLIHLNWRGEPLMNKQFLSILKFAKSNCKLPLHWHTNGILLSDKTCEEICENSSQNMKLYISIDGGTKETHDKNRGSGTFKKSLAGLRKLLETRKNNQLPFIGVYTINMGIPESNYDEEFKKILEDVDEHCVVDPLYADLHSFQKFNSNLKIDELPSNISNFEAHNISKSVPKGPCFWAGNSLAIAPNGDAYVCIVTHDEKGKLGNILEDNIDNIILKSNHFRDQIISEGRRNVKHCESCYKGEIKTTAANNVYSA